jgi:hypothetical protein
MAEQAIEHPDCHAHRQRQQHRERVEHQHQQRRNQPHQGFRVVRAKEFGEITRGTSFGGYTGALCIDVGLLHLEIGEPLGGSMTVGHELGAVFVGRDI